MITPRVSKKLPRRLPVKTEESAPEETESPPDYSWIEGYVASLAGELRAAGYEEEKVDALAGELRSCLTRQVKAGERRF